MITLQFSTRRGLVARWIRWFTWSEFSHVSFVGQTNTGEEYLLGSTAWHGVHYEWPKEEIPSYTHYARFEVPECPSDALRFAATQVGKPYDFTALAGFLFRRDWAEEDSWFCSELVYWAFLQAGYRPFRTEQLHRITPQHLLMIPSLRLIEEFKVP